MRHGLLLPPPVHQPLPPSPLPGTSLSFTKVSCLHCAAFKVSFMSQYWCESVHLFVQGVRQLPFESRHLLRLDDLPGAPTTAARLMEAGEQLLPPRARPRGQRSRGDGQTACSRLLCHVEGHPSKRRDGVANRRGRVPTVQAKIHPAAHPGPQQHPCNLKAVHPAHLFSSSVHATQTNHLAL